MLNGTLRKIIITQHKVKRTVQTIKGLLKKGIRSGDDPYRTLFNFRTCASPDGKPSPAMLIMNRKLKTHLADLGERTLSTESLKQKQHYDKGKNSLSEFHNGSNARLHDGKGWSIRRQVVDKAKTPRSCIIQTETGGQLRRNHQDILATP